MALQTSHVVKGGLEQLLYLPLVCSRFFFVVGSIEISRRRRFIGNLPAAGDRVE